MVYFILRFISIVLFKLLFRFQSHGKKNIPRKGSFILASNHASFLDPIGIGCASSRRLNYMARQDLFDNKLFGALLFAINVFPLKRDTADLGALKEALRRLNSGKGLVLFPSGTRTPDGSVEKFYEGVGFLAVNSGSVIIPTFIKGSGNAWPKGAKFIKSAKIDIFFGKPIQPDEIKGNFKKEIYAQLTDRTLQEIRNLESAN